MFTVEMCQLVDDRGKLRSPGRLRVDLHQELHGYVNGFLEQASGCIDLSLPVDMILNGSGTL